MPGTVDIYWPSIFTLYLHLKTRSRSVFELAVDRELSIKLTGLL